MTHALLALALALADPFGFPTPRSAAAAPAAAPSAAAPSAAGPTAAAAPAGASAGPALALPASGWAPDALILPVAALLALAFAALWASRRKQQVSRIVQVLETTGLGPKRSLVVARIGDELMVIGSSEAGLQLLATRPAGQEVRLASAPRLAAVPDPAPPAGGGPMGRLLGRLRRRPAAPAAALASLDAPAFDSLLAESSEDQELRRKLALGQAGSVR